MADVPISRTPQPDPTGGPGRLEKTGAVPAKGGQRPSENKSEGVAFKALLEKLEERARALEETTKTVDDATNLAGAVEGARASLEDALSLSDQLLEAYREARQQTDLPRSRGEGSRGA